MKRLLSVSAAALLLTACAGASAPPPLEAEYHDDSSISETQTAETADASQPEQTDPTASAETETPAEPAVSYMEQYGGLMTEMPPAEIMPSIALIVVLLPAPFSPISPIMQPCGRVRSTGPSEKPP